MCEGMPIYKYLAYGLNIASEIECPELVAGNGAPDVRVRYGRVPERLENPTGQGVLYQVSHDQFLLNLGRIARFRIANGDDIVIERDPESSENDVRVFLLGSAFGALLHQRGFLPLHASAIETSQGAVAFAGPVGLGKSTLAGAFHKRGYRILADDVCAVSLNRHGKPQVTPAYPQLNLWADALEKLGSPMHHPQRLRALTEKYGLPVSAQFSTSTVPLYAVYALRTTNDPELSLTHVRGFDKIGFIRDNTFRRRFLKGMNHRDRYMGIVSATAQHIRAARIVRPEGVFCLDELTDLAEKDFRV
jgi:hypothetical protein